MLEYANLVELITKEKNTATKGITFIDSSQQKTFLSYAALYEAALDVLACLQHKGVRPTDELVLQLEDNRTFVTVFWACILGGIIPVPISVGHNDEHKLKLFNVWAILNKPWLAIAQQQLPTLGKFADNTGQTAYATMEQRAVDVEELLAYKGTAVIHQPHEDDTAFIQFSSGSTGRPKGVVLSHKNLIANLEGIGTSASYASEDSTLSWMPLTHDMGLIGFHLNPIYYGMNQYLIPTNLFVRSPAIWLHMASEYRVTVICSPNFGYNYVLKHCAAAQPNWDLSGVRLLYNGAEPIAVSLCQEFLAFAAQYGLRSTVMCPVYGLAEASLGVSISSLDDEVQWVSVNRTKLSLYDAVEIGEEGEDNILVVNVGKAVKHCSVRVVGADNVVLPDATIGEIAIKGINVTKGYYNNPTATAAVISADGWLRTGDLGFIREDNVYITGRAKDIVFINGQNYYPHDIERVAEEVAGVELNKVAVAGRYDAESEREEVLVFILYRGALEGFARIAAEVKVVINNTIGLAVDALIPVRDIPRTTSGKLQRFKLLERYNNGEYTKVKAEVAALLQATASQVQTVAPANETEEQLLAVWQKVLHTEAIGVTDNFFQIGGNSLRAAEMAIQLQKVLRVELPIEMVYQHPTVRELAAQIVTLDRQEFVAIPVAAEQPHYPLSSTQRGIFHHWQADKTSVAYNLPVAWVLAGDVQVPKLEQCLRQLLQRHDVFRTRFHLEPAPSFSIAPTTAFSLLVEACDEHSVRQRLQHLVAPFDLSAGPLYRIVLLQVSDGRHILFTDFHHIISDGLSVHYFLQELQLLYAGKTPAAPLLQYQDYSTWENEHSAAAKLRQQGAYWQQALPETLPVLQMPADFLRPSLFENTGKKLHYTLSESLTGQLQQLAKDQGVTLHVVLLAAYHLLLATYTGQSEAIIGIPVAGRRHPELQTMQGMFVNNLPLWLNTADSQSFAAFLGSVKQRVSAALQNQDYPFERMISDRAAPRDVSRSPIFDTMFVYQNMGLPQLPGAALRFEQYVFDPGSSKFDISLEVLEDAAALRYNIEYATALFADATIVRLATHFEQLLRNVVAHPEQPLAALSCLGEKEYEEQITLLNATTTEYARNSTIQQLFAEQVAATPTAIALEYEGTTLTYAALDAKATALALVLQQQGVVRNSITAIVLDRSPELVIAILAVLKSGGAYLPVDTELPKERISYLLADSKCVLAITDASYRELLADETGATPAAYAVLDVNQVDYAPSSTPLAVAAAPTDLAYVIYTSGTTGLPKGVMIEQRSLVNYISWAAESYLSAGENTFALYTSVSFDLTITSIFTPLVTGNKMVIYKKDDTQLLVEKVIADNKATIIKLTPSHLRILQYAEDAAVGSRVRTFIVGGEQLETQLARLISAKYGVTIYNEYGPTEATVGCMIYKFAPEETAANVPVGLPAANTQVYLLDAALQPVPYGVPGEMYISGDGVARGYLYREALTQEKFLANPFVAGSRMYKTGDKAKRLTNGTIAYLGRFDQQVKINGYRIEPAEIEQQLLEHELVTAAVVAVKKDPVGQPFLCAYYKSVTPLDTATLSHFLLSRLPHYMVPARYVEVEAFPLTQNGKVDLAALLQLAGPQKAPAAALPANETEALSLKIWGDVLRAKNISVSDSFFELGGDSIKAVQIVSRLFEQGIVVQVKDILRYRTIAQVNLHATAVHNPQQYAQEPATGEKLLSPIEGWFLAQRLQNPHFYVQSVLLTLQKPVKLELLELAFARLIGLHDALRLNYNQEQGVLFYNHEHLNQAFHLEQLEADTAGEEANTVAEQLTRIKASFDITKTLLLKAAWLPEATGFGKLFITAHHLVMDGVSWRILLEDLYNIYGALEAEAEVKLPLKKAGLQHYSAALQQFVASGAVAAEAAYWEQLEATRFAVPTDGAADNALVKDQRTISRTLDAGATSFLLTEAHTVYRTDVVTLLNAALVLALHEWTGQTQIVIEQENKGRHLDEEGTARTIGWFTTMYPVLFPVASNAPKQLLMMVKEQLRAVPNHGMGYGILRYFNRTPAEWSSQSITPVRFNYLGQFEEQLNNDMFAYDQQDTGADSDPDNRMTAALELNAIVNNGIFQLQITHNTLLHNEETIRQLADSFFAKLSFILDHIRNEKDVHFTVSDFSMADLDEEDLNVLFSN